MINRKNSTKRLSFLLVLIIVFTSMFCTSVYASTNNYSAEDMYSLFPNESSEDAVGTALPSWGVLKQLYNDYDKKIEATGEEKVKIQAKRDLAKQVVMGFDKSSEYQKWKTEMEALCTYDVENKEIKLASDPPTEDEQLKYTSLMTQFESALLRAEIQSMTGNQSDSYDLGGFGRVFVKGTSIVISVVRAIMFELGRIGLTVSSFVFLCELFYVGVEPLRPLLGFETKPLFKKFKNENTGLQERYEDHGVVLRLVGQAARKAVEDEFKIESMDNVVKNNVLVGFLLRKIKYMVAVVLAVVLINTDIWGWICIKILDFGASLIS